MKRSYIYMIVVLLTITLVSSDYIISKDLQNIIPLDEKYRTIENADATKEANVLTTITIKNEQNTDKNIVYKYNIEIPEISGAYRYKYNNKEGYIVFTADGKTNFELNSNESIVIYDVPVDTEYTITQETTNEEYVTKVGQSETTTYKAKTTNDNNVTFNNSTKVEEQKPTQEQPNQEQPKKDNKANKKDIPNTGETEIRMAVLLLLAFLTIYCIRKIKVKRFE